MARTKSGAIVAGKAKDNAEAFGLLQAWHPRESQEESEVFWAPKHWNSKSALVGMKAGPIEVNEQKQTI